MVVIALVPSLLIIPKLGAVLRDVSHRQAVATLQTAAEGTAQELARNFQEQWFGVERLARFAQGDGDLMRFRQRLDTVVATMPLFAWVGLADTSGKVLAASDGVLEGQNVAARPWFKAGLSGNFAGDVHDAVLLQRALRIPASDPLRLIDFSLPVHRADGVPSGVFGAHVRWSTVSGLIRASNRPNGTELLLVSRDGVVLVGPSAFEGKQLALRAVQAAEQGVSRSSVETWADGQDYLTVSMPLPGSKDVPSFGWSLVARQPAAAALGETRSVAAELVPLVAVSALFIVAAAWVFGWWIARPMGRLAAAAANMVDGTTHQPVPEERLYAEVAEISASLAKLESRIAGRAGV